MQYGTKSWFLKMSSKVWGKLEKTGNFFYSVGFFVGVFNPVFFKITSFSGFCNLCFFDFCGVFLPLTKEVN